jgi:CreA protein
MDEQAATQADATIPFQYDEQLVISVNVSDFGRSLEWYRDVLGFELLYRMDHIGWGEVKTPWGGVTIGLSQTEEQRTGGTVPTFGVTDIEAARADLESCGVRLDETFDVEGMVKLMGFYDPDGNPWMFAQTTRDFRG